MEADRFKQNNILFITCMICLILSLSLFTVGFYILPYLIWGWNYSVPSFTLTWTEWLKDNYALSQAKANAMVFFMLIIPALITGIISYLTSNRIENAILGISQEKIPEQYVASNELKESMSFTAKLLMIIVLVIIAVLIVEWMITVPTPPPEFL